MEQSFPCYFPAPPIRFAEILSVTDCNGDAYSAFSRNSLNDSLQKAKKCEFRAEFDGFGEKIKKYAAKFPEAGIMRRWRITWHENGGQPGVQAMCERLLGGPQFPVGKDPAKQADPRR